MPKKVTYKEIEKWIRLNENYSVLEISEMVKRNHGVLYRNFKKINYKPKKNKGLADGRKKISDEKIIKVYKDYISNKKITITLMAKKYNISTRTLYERFHLLFLPIKDFKTICHNYNIKHDFFSKIDSEIKAYLLGFFAADGHIKNKDYYTLSVYVHYKDFEIINLFNKYIANGKLKIYKSVNMVGLSITSKQIGQDLKKLGYDNRKTYTCKHIPDISKKYIRHFIRGYFDGDGTIAYYMRKRNNRPSSSIHRYFSIPAKNKGIVIDIFKELEMDHAKIYYSKKNDFYNARIFNKKDLKKIYAYLYSYSKYYLKRKKKIFDQVICDGFLRKIKY